MRWWDEECFEEFDVVDPLQLERLGPVDDVEVERLEDLCRTGTPGPLVIDDHSDGSGVLVATLPDGRRIVSQRAGVTDEEESRAAVEANARLICRARCMVLRMVHDRRYRQRREQELLERIERLERELERVRGAGSEVHGGSSPRRPR